MGITISSSKRSLDMGFFGFGRFRIDVAKQTNDDFYEHYKTMYDAQMLFGIDREVFFEEFDKKTKEFEKKGIVKQEVLDFLFQSDCEGKISKTQAKMIYDLIKDIPNDIIYGYSGREDCAKSEHMKKLFKDCYSNSKQIVWW